MAKGAKLSVYSSASMRERRRRILAVTRELIAEQGIDGFSINMLCQRANIAKQTLYNGFTGREALIAAAITDSYEEYETSIPYRSAAGTLDRMIERTAAVAKRNLAIRSYIGQIASYYFSHSDNSDLRRHLHGIAREVTTPYLERVSAAGDLQPWMSLENLTCGLDDQRMMVTYNWTRGDLDDDAYVQMLTVAMLAFLLGSVRGDSHHELRDVLHRIAKIGVTAYVSQL